jgi:NAD(P)-dependent dehydrogenase (short-subunit alcohol dehydrogenase family)
MAAIHDVADLSIAVVGGTTGLGFSAAKALVTHGARVVLCGRSQDSVNRALAGLGKNARGFAGNAMDPATAERAVQMAVTEFGSLDGLYHVAGGSGRGHGDGPLHEISGEGWDFTMSQNLTSVFHSNRAALQQFISQGRGGAILNMSSVLSWSPSPEFFASHAYAAAKAAVIGLSKAAASYYAPQNIRVNVIAPALVETPMSQRATGNAGIMRFIKSKQPLDGGRIGLPQDLDGAALFLLSRQSHFITGQVLAVDGGWTVSEGNVAGVE